MASMCSAKSISALMRVLEKWLGQCGGRANGPRRYFKPCRGSRPLQSHGGDQFVEFITGEPERPGAADRRAPIGDGNSNIKPAGPRWRRLRHEPEQPLGLADEALIFLGRGGIREPFTATVNSVPGPGLRRRACRVRRVWGH
jgi:hypothetical protein